MLRYLTRRYNSLITLLFFPPSSYLFPLLAAKIPPLRGVTQQEIDYEMKLDAFMTLMGVKAARGACPSKTGCTPAIKASGYDYCTQVKISGRGCGKCNTKAVGGFGMCQGPNVDVDEEMEIVNSMTKEELLEVAADAMMMDM